MSKFLEAIAFICWLFVLLNELIFELWANNEFVLWTALLFTLWALLYEVRARKPTP